MKSLECEIVSEIADTRTSCSVEGRGQGRPVQDQLPAHHQGETPATHQSPGPARPGESISCSSEVTSREAGHSNLNYRWGGGTLGSSDQPPQGGRGGS